jgi:hypothetical protein
MQKPGEVFAALLVDQKGSIIETFAKVPLGYGEERIDLQGSQIFPGFIDTHTHSFEGGLYTYAADLGSCRDLKEIFEKLSETEAIDNTIIAFNFDENLISEKRFPNRRELDRLFPSKSCLIRRTDGHSVQINSRLIKELASDIRKQGNILKTNLNELNRKEEGAFRGDLNDFICHWFHQNLTEEWILRAYQKGAERAVKTGHTTIHTMIGDAKKNPLHYSFLQEMIKKEQFPVDFILYPQILDVQKALELNAGRIGGCILADGSFGSGTAALTEAYLNDPENKGFLYKTDEEWETFIFEAHNNNLQIGVHCIGDAAIRQILTHYVRAQRQNPKDLRHQIIHSELITNDEIIGLMSEYGVAAVMQPVFDQLWGGAKGFYSTLLGSERALQCNRLHSLVQAGVLVTGSSDWYVTALDALQGVQAAVNLHNPVERLTPYQAMELYTKNAAVLSGDEKRIGTLSQGKEADFVCLAGNPLEEKNISCIPVLEVFKRGKAVYRRDEF